MTSTLAALTATTIPALFGIEWLDPETLLQAGGWAALVLACAFVFLETGVLVLAFLPGDSLLFTVGLFSATGIIDVPIWITCLLLFVFAFAGDQMGFMIGRKLGPAIFNRKKSRLFNPENVARTHEFFEKHGPKALVLARFVPIVRTFTPIVAGVSGMRYRSFILFNVIGGTLWGAGVTLLGAALGQIDFVHENIEAMLVGIVLLSVLPIVIEYLRSRKKSAAAATESSVPAPSGEVPPRKGGGKHARR